MVEKQCKSDAPRQGPISVRRSRRALAEMRGAELPHRGTVATRELDAIRRSEALELENMGRTLPRRLAAGISA
jgi:hypothetical protein